MKYLIQMINEGEEFPFEDMCAAVAYMNDGEYVAAVVDLEKEDEFETAIHDRRGILYWEVEEFWLFVVYTAPLADGIDSSKEKFDAILASVNPEIFDVKDGEWQHGDDYGLSMTVSAHQDGSVIERSEGSPNEALEMDQRYEFHPDAVKA